MAGQPGNRTEIKGGFVKRKTFYLRNSAVKQNLRNFIDSLPTDENTPLTVIIGDAPRNLSQNDKFHAICGDVAKQISLGNIWLNDWQWKNVFVSGHWMVENNAETSPLIEGIEGEWLNIRESTAQMGKKRMASLIEYSTAYAIQNGVRLCDVRYSGDYFGRVA